MTAIAAMVLQGLVGALPIIATLAYLSLRPGTEFLREALWIAALLGALAAVPIAATELLVALPIPSLSDIYLQSAVHALLIAAIPEEVGKFIILTLLVLRHEDVTRPTQAIVLATAVSLGFAGIENALYVAESNTWATTAVARLVTALPMHAATGLVMGYFAARAAAYPHARGWNTALMLLAPIALHAGYDFPVFVLLQIGVFSGGPLTPQGIPFLTMFVGALLIVVGSAFFVISQISTFRQPAPSTQ